MGFKGKIIHEKPRPLLVPLSIGGTIVTVQKVSSAPVDAELTGPYFTPDGKTLFLSVQHPGETSPSLDNFSSHWPDGGSNMPRSSAVAITGKLLEDIMG